MKKEKTLRMAVTGALLLTVVAAGISMYRTDTTPKKESKAQQEEESKDVTSKDAEAQDTGELAKNTTENQEATPSPTMNQDNPDNAIPPAQEDENGQETADARESADTSAAVQPELNFTEDSQMLWPVNGQVVIDYSMDATTYFPTLDQYKYNDALMLGCRKRRAGTGSSQRSGSFDQRRRRDRNHHGHGSRKRLSGNLRPAQRHHRRTGTDRGERNHPWLCQ